MDISVFGATDMGKIRELNEDSFGIYGFCDAKPFGFCIIADGMGGHQAGEIASAAAVKLLTEYLEDLFTDADKFNIESFGDVINGAFDYANYDIYKMSLTNYGQHGMGTTTVAAFIFGINVWIANVGDSRAYLVRENKISQITKDHSMVAELIDRGGLTKEEAKTHPDRNIITRAMGTEKYVDTDIFRFSAKPGDKLILCSDGLSEMLEDEEILAAVNIGESSDISDTVAVKENMPVGTDSCKGLDNIGAFPTPESAAVELIRKANLYGGRDNITVICIYFGEGGEEK